MQNAAPLVIAKQGYFFVGGQYFEGLDTYVLDQPARGRSPWHPEMGALTRHSTQRVERQFTAPASARLWPQAHLHTQFPGTGQYGDPIFDQTFAQNFPSLASFARQQELNRDAGAALLDKIGPAILLTHSQSGTFGWLVADARPGLVKAILAIEPSGPPVYDNVTIGAPDWFKEGPFTKPYGLTAAPLTYDPPLNDGEQLSFVRQDTANGPELVRCWSQAEPARQLTYLRDVPVLIVQGEASYHAPFDHCTQAYLEQAGVAVSYLRLADHGQSGNGHMLMIEKNNLQIAELIENWMHTHLNKSRVDTSAQDQA
ncbi:MAG: alpha/beta fold hydrolase [Alphaproteobacteria bacterium]|nr:alpha/beta fold hydrolase [Alphaproteobacteria bacterium]